MKYAVVLLVLAVAGCAAIQNQMAADSEDMLAEAGFERAPLEAPGLPSRQLVQTGGTYAFADPDFCRCMYVGGADQYAKLERLRAQRIADREWDMKHGAFGNAYSKLQWGPWKPEGLDLATAPSATRAAAGR